MFYRLPLLCETLTGGALTHIERHKKEDFKDKIKSELCGGFKNLHHHTF